MTIDEVYQAIDNEIQRSGSQVAAAAKLQISPQYLNDIRKRRRELSDAVLAALGIEKIIMYRYKDSPDANGNFH